VDLIDVLDIKRNNERWAAERDGAWRLQLELVHAGMCRYFAACGHMQLPGQTVCPDHAGCTRCRCKPTNLLTRARVLTPY
jgi:hypothetical protein